MKFIVDIDGTICTTKHGDYNNSKPDLKMISMINNLFDNGHTIHYYTARGTVTGIDWYSLTKSQLVDWGVKFHELMMGKPEADFFIDDKAVNPHFMKDIMKKLMGISS